MHQENVFRLDLPADLKYLNVLDALVSAVLSRADNLPDSEATTYNAQLAIHEISTNIVEHAYSGIEGGRIEVTLTLFENPFRLIVDLKDTGRPFDPATVEEPDLEQGQVRGYGLFITRNLMQEVTYHREMNSNFWQLVMET